VWCACASGVLRISVSPSDAPACASCNRYGRIAGACIAATPHILDRQYLLLRALPVERPTGSCCSCRTRAVVNTTSPWSNPVVGADPGSLCRSVRRRSRLRRTTRFNFSQGGELISSTAFYATASIFDALRVPPLLGRSFAAEDDRRGGGPNGAVAVIKLCPLAAPVRRLGGRHRQDTNDDRVPSRLSA